jgi:hypothetical protein
MELRLFSTHQQQLPLLGEIWVMWHIKGKHSASMILDKQFSEHACGAFCNRKEATTISHS